MHSLCVAELAACFKVCLNMVLTFILISLPASYVGSQQESITQVPSHIYNASAGISMLPDSRGLLMCQDH